jgi:hypothetical protein
MSQTLVQKTNLSGFPKAGELIEITGAHALGAADRAILNLLYQHAHDSGRLGEIDAEWELPMAAIRPSKHESNDRLRDCLERLMRVVVLERSNRWGRIKAEVVCAMTSKYAMALYELVQLRSGLDRCVEHFSLERFRDLLGVPPGKLTRGPDFERRVIEPALLEVNGLSAGTHEMRGMYR